MRQLYLLSGLGADKRVFDNLDLSGFSVVHIDWITPSPDETIEQYAGRLVALITDPRPVLIGVSFGGMVAIEIAKQIQAEAVIIISSAKTRSEIPGAFRVLGKLGIHKLAPSWLLKTSNPLTSWFFGARTITDKQLLATMLSETDEQFLRWAIHSILTWKNVTTPKNTTHIHGSLDRLLPGATASIRIERGGHLMIINRGAELSALIRKILG
jgi:pimeloyl-ACP methyl ester carboxylesterase